MKSQKIKRYRLGVSRTFPTTHARKGEETKFVDKILFTIGCPDCNSIQYLTGKNISNCNSCEIHAMGTKKLHTIRCNSELWEKRMVEVQAGRAVIELFYWSGKPYHKDENGIGQVVFATLDKDSGCGVQKIKIKDWYRELYYTFEINGVWFPHTTLSYSDQRQYFAEKIAKNDGLSFADFKEWFRKYDLSKTMAIIHFTSFRY
jgi:hypothetical protein